MILKTLLLALVTLVVVGNAQDTNNAGTLEADSRLSDFVFWLNKIGLSPGDGDILFAPINEAWEALDAADNENHDVWQKYSTQPEFIIHLVHVVSNHAALGDDPETKLNTAQIWDGSRQGLKSQQGNMTITQSPDTVDGVPRSAIVEADIETTDGIINVMNQVIWPAYLAEGIVAQLFDDRSWKFAFTTMANLILHVGLEDQIDGFYENGLTMLVPPNRRFNRGEINIPLLLTNEMFDYTTEFIKCHMIKYIHHSQSIYATEETQWLLKTELGTHLWVTTTEDQIRFQSETTLLLDQPTRFG
jgi:uncharacterized surface protein with fasciclin (FAS1) repeats